MNELKPEDVMKALECCNTKGNCNQCPYEIVGEYTPCYSALTQDALALLREKDAEIERLKAYIQRCKSGEEYWVKCLLERPQEARADAITEFAERLIAKKCHYTETEHTFDFDGVTVEDIYQIAKEMKGETDEN